MYTRRTTLDIASKRKPVLHAHAPCWGYLWFTLGFAVYSCFPTQQQRNEYAEKQRIKAERWAKFETYQDDETGETDVHRYPVPDTPGPQGLNPMTPRTLAFNTLGGTKDLPLRNHFSSPNAPNVATSPSLAIRSPDIPRSPMSPGFINRAGMGSDRSNGKSPEVEAEHFSPQNGAPQLYFPPPAEEVDEVRLKLRNSKGPDCPLARLQFAAPCEGR